MTTDELLAECRAVLPRLTWVQIGPGAVVCGQGNGGHAFVRSIRARYFVAWSHEDREYGTTPRAALYALAIAVAERLEDAVEEVSRLTSLSDVLEVE